MIELIIELINILISGSVSNDFYEKQINSDLIINFDLESKKELDIEYQLEKDLFGDDHDTEIYDIKHL
jgi:hypothetical protein